MGDKQEKKFSFSLTSTKPLPPKSSSSSSSQIEFLTIFDSSSSSPQNPKPKLTIPPIPNADLRRGGIDPVKQPEEALRRLKEEINSLPEARGAEEYREVPVGEFAPAVLAGYGWIEGRGIGRNNSQHSIFKPGELASRG